MNLHHDVQMISGDFVLLPRARYDALLKQTKLRPRYMTEEEMDERDSKLAEDMMKKIRAGTMSMIPSEVVDMVLDEGLSDIRAWRLHRKMTLADLAKKTKLTSAYISQIESKKRKPTVATLKKLAKALGTGIDALIED